VAVVILFCVAAARLMDGPQPVPEGLGDGDEQTVEWLAGVARDGRPCALAARREIDVYVLARICDAARKAIAAARTDRRYDPRGGWPGLYETGSFAAITLPREPAVR
jgi:hypothetical protein